MNLVDQVKKLRERVADPTSRSSGYAPMTDARSAAPNNMSVGSNAMAQRP